MTDASLDGVQNNPREPKHDPAMSYQADRRSDRHNLPLIAFSPFPNSLRLSNPNEYLVNRNRTPLRELVDPPTQVTKSMIRGQADLERQVAAL